MFFFQFTTIDWLIDRMIDSIDSFINCLGFIMHKLTGTNLLFNPNDTLKSKNKIIFPLSFSSSSLLFQLFVFFRWAFLNVLVINLVCQRRKLTRIDHGRQHLKTPPPQLTKAYELHPNTNKHKVKSI
jgi:hypothetical protein